MGARHSKRSVDISGKDSKEGVADDPQPLEGKLEKIEEGAKVAVNGASHSESKVADEDHVPNGDPTKDVGSDAALSSPSSPTAECAPAAQECDDQESSQSQPPKKKDKVKKKWSFRSISFSKKEKPKSGKDEAPKDDPELVAEIAEEKMNTNTNTSGILGSFSQSVETAVEQAVAQAEDGIKTTMDAALESVEEQSASTKDQVEKITAKVAEKAEALVVKMEAMKIEAADAVVSAVGLGQNELEVVTLDVEAAALKVESKAASKVEEIASELEATPLELEITGSDADVTAVEKEVTASDLDKSTSEQLVAAIPKMEVPALKESLAETSLEAVSPQKMETNIVQTLPESVLAAEQSVERVTEEIPPPLPASPPPSEVIADLVLQVVNNAVSIGEANELATFLGNVHITPLDKNVPLHSQKLTSLFEPVLKPDPAQASGDEDRHDMASRPLMSGCGPSNIPGDGEVQSQVIEAVEEIISSVCASSESDIQVEQQGSAEDEPLDKVAGGKVSHDN